MKHKNWCPTQKSSRHINSVLDFYGKDKKTDKKAKSQM